MAGLAVPKLTVVRTRCRVLAVYLAFGLFWQNDASADDLGDNHQSLRRPTVLVLCPDGDTLFVGNRDSGSIQIVETDSQRVISEVPVGQSVAAMCFVDSDRLLVADGRGSQVLMLRKHGGKTTEWWSVVSSVEVHGYPSAIVFDAREGISHVTSTWSRQLTSFRVEGDSLRKLRTASLPLSPRRLLLLPHENRLLVSGAFDAAIVHVDCLTGSLSDVVGLGGHNLGKPCVDPARGELLFPMQGMSPHAEATFNDVHWGNLMSNQVQVIPLQDSRNASTRKPYAVQLGEPGRGAGDPSCVVPLSSDRFAVLVAGRDEVHMWQRSPESGAGEFVATIPVGSRPLDGVVHQGKLYVANQLSDTISVVDVKANRVSKEIQLGDAHLDLTLVQRGEKLFFDSRLSLEGWMSCHSCHTDGHSNGQLNDNLSDGGFGSPKRVLSLLGVKETPPWTWTGRVTSLRDQVVNSITKTMQGSAPSDDQVDAIAAYMDSLSRPRNLHEERSSNQTMKGGANVFRELNCNRCHAPPTYTTPNVYDVGLRDTEGNKSFNPPSLRGVSQRTVFFHDGRAETLRDVFVTHQHQLESPLDEVALQQLLEFLNSLNEATDSGALEKNSE
ncbi:MAG: cytochrome c peroxidase [Planctomycetota bacterium]